MKKELSSKDISKIFNLSQQVMVKEENGNYAKEERSLITPILHDTPFRYNLDHSLGVVEEVKPLKNQKTGEVYRAL